LKGPSIGLVALSLLTNKERQMFNPVSKDYYSRLGLQKESSYKDVKEAFLVAVRQYPPEQDPENYKQIREAYDTLIDQHAREVYN